MGYPTQRTGRLNFLNVNGHIVLPIFSACRFRILLRQTGSCNRTDGDLLRH
jgi:hypothetical protein